MGDKSGLGRLVALLFLTMLFCAGMYFLPASVLGYKIKRVDLLSDFKVEEKALSLDSLRLMLILPCEVYSVPLRALRVGSTQSNMSMPAAMPLAMSSGVPTPMR